MTIQLKEHQQALLDDKSPRILASWGRATGKTTVIEERLKRATKDSVLIVRDEHMLRHMATSLGIRFKSGNMKVGLTPNGPTIHFATSRTFNIHDYTHLDIDAFILDEPAHLNGEILLDVLKLENVDQLYYIGTPRPVDKFSDNMFSVLYSLRDYLGLSYHTVDLSALVEGTVLERLAYENNGDKRRWMTEVQGKFVKKENHVYEII